MNVVDCRRVFCRDEKIELLVHYGYTFIILFLSARISLRLCRMVLYRQNAIVKLSRERFCTGVLFVLLHDCPI